METQLLSKEEAEALGYVDLSPEELEALGVSLQDDSPSIGMGDLKEAEYRASTKSAPTSADRFKTWLASQSAIVS